MGLKELHATTLAEATRRFERLSPSQLAARSVCDGWTVGEVVGHLSGVNRGVARTIRGGSYDPDDYGPAAATVAVWRLSAVDVTEAVAGTPLDWQVEGSGDGDVVPVSDLLTRHLMEVTVHLDDVCRALRESYRPPDEVVSLVLQLLRSGDRVLLATVGDPFAPPVRRDGDDWEAVLGLAGRP